MAEFLEYYQIDESEIQKYALNEFLDFFEVTKNDLLMKSKEEVFLALLGFSMDREAEREEQKNLADWFADDVCEAVFQYNSGSERECGRIDFIDRRLEYGKGVCFFTGSDKMILLQALKDFEYMKPTVINNDSEAGQVCEIEIMDVRGNRYREKTPAVHGEMFRQIVGIIMERRGQ